MGWWPTGKEGTIDTNGLRSKELLGVEASLWGDGPADIMDRAIADIDKTFRECVGRGPTKKELKRGLRFSLGGLS